jgi:hypothetical protein
MLETYRKVEGVSSDDLMGVRRWVHPRGNERVGAFDGELRACEAEHILRRSVLAARVFQCILKMRRVSECLSEGLAVQLRRELASIFVLLVDRISCVVANLTPRSMDDGSAILPANQSSHLTSLNSITRSDSHAVCIGSWR